jgi:uncharacterized protein (TIGR03067 family)
LSLCHFGPGIKSEGTNQECSHGATHRLLPASLIALGADVKKDSAPQEKPASWDGIWKLVSIERDGETRMLPDPQPRWLIKEGKAFYGGQELAALTVDATTTPPCVDLAFRRPKAAYEGIYSLGDKILKVCIGAEGRKERPLEFDTKDKPGLRILMFQREEPRDGIEFEGVTGTIGAGLRIEKGKGIVISGTEDGGNAAKAGLRTGDLVVKVGNTEVREDLGAAIGAVQRSKPGNDLTLTVKRDDKEQRIKVKVAVLPFRLN